MGSTGVGKFGTYRIGNGQTTGGIRAGNDGSGGDGIGSGSGEIGCPSVIENIRLEDVATSEYHVNHHSLPSKGDQVELNNSVYKGRLVIIAKSTGDDVIGNLPTQYNYLINCIKKGMQYTGTVVASGMTPIPFVVVSLYV